MWGRDGGEHEGRAAEEKARLLSASRRPPPGLPVHALLTDGGLLVDVPLQATQMLGFIILLFYGSVMYSVVSFRCTAKRVRNADTDIYIFSDSFFHYMS